jgi:hypothetical protein
MANDFILESSLPRLSLDLVMQMYFLVTAYDATLLSEKYAAELIKRLQPNNFVEVFTLIIRIIIYQNNTVWIRFFDVLLGITVVCGIFLRTMRCFIQLHHNVLLMDMQERKPLLR